MSFQDKERPEISSSDGRKRRVQLSGREEDQKDDGSKEQSRNLGNRTVRQGKGAPAIQHTDDAVIAHDHISVSTVVPFPCQKKAAPRTGVDVCDNHEKGPSSSELVSSSEANGECNALTTIGRREEEAKEDGCKKQSKDLRARTIKQSKASALVQQHTDDTVIAARDHEKGSTVVPFACQKLEAPQTDDDKHGDICDSHEKGPPASARVSASEDDGGCDAQTTIGEKEGKDGFRPRNIIRIPVAVIIPVNEGRAYTGSKEGVRVISDRTETDTIVPNTSGHQNRRVITRDASEPQSPGEHTHAHTCRAQSSSKCGEKHAVDHIHNHSKPDTHTRRNDDQGGGSSTGVRSNEVASMGGSHGESGRRQRSPGPPIRVEAIIPPMKKKKSAAKKGEKKGDKRAVPRARSPSPSPPIFVVDRPMVQEVRYQNGSFVIPAGTLGMNFKALRERRRFDL